MPKARRPRRPYVHELQLKVEGLVGAWTMSLEELYELSGVQKNSLRPTDRRDDRLGAEDQRRLAELFGFSVEWEQWCEVGQDAKAAVGRLDTAKAFLTRYRNEKPKKLNLGKRASTVTQTASERVPTDRGQQEEYERVTTEKLKVAWSGTPAPPAFRDFVSVILEPGQTDAGISDAGARVLAGSYYMPQTGRSLTVSMGIVTVECGQARADMKTVKGIDPPAFTVPGSAGDVEWASAGATDERLSWRVTASGLSLGNMLIAPGGLARIVDIAHGDEIDISFGTWFCLIHGAKKVEGSALHFPDRSGKEPPLTDTDLSIVQQRLIEHLEKRRVDCDEDHFAVIARYRVRFGRR